MSHLPMDILKVRVACARTCYPIGAEISHHGTQDKYRMIGHCIIEKTDKLGVWYQPVHYPDVTLVADPDEFHRLDLAKSEDDWFDAAERLRNLAQAIPKETATTHQKSGGRYRVIGHCVLGNELAEGLLYTSDAHQSVAFARPFAEFNEVVDIEGVAAPRFVFDLPTKLPDDLPVLGQV
jgi:hypothetical protein